MLRLRSATEGEKRKMKIQYLNLTLALAKIEKPKRMSFSLIIKIVLKEILRLHFYISPNNRAISIIR